MVGKITQQITYYIGVTNIVQDIVQHALDQLQFYFECEYTSFYVNCVHYFEFEYAL